MRLIDADKLTEEWLDAENEPAYCANDVIDDICKDCDRIPVSDFKEYKRYSDDEYIDMCRRVDQLYAIIDELTGDADAVIHGWRPKMVEDNTNKSYIELK